jgi:hypothetical protein
MGIRDMINENPRRAAAAAGVLVLLTLGLILWETVGGSPKPSAAAPMAYFSDDDGQTYFIGDLSQVPPFDHNGRIAVIAQVFRCGDGGKPFVAYLVKYDEKSKAAMEQELQVSPRLMPNEMAQYPILAKKPGASRWVPDTPRTAEYQAVTTPVCPDGGSGVPQQLGMSE